jgi:hypothetical protein
LRSINKCVRFDLSCAYGSDVGASSWEARVKCPGCAVVHGSSCTFGVGAALAAISCDSVVTGGVQEGDTCEAEFHVLVALTVLIGGGEIGFVLSVGSRDY